MSETPKCPYCGDRMEIHVRPHTTEQEFFSAWYQCVTCESASPRIEFIGNTSQTKIEERLQAVSSRRVVPKNRVLTLEEVKKSNAVWVEGKSGQLTLPPIPVLVYGEAADDCNSNTPCIALVDANADMADYLVDDYNHNWRCWLCKPTKEEMEATLWAK